MLGERILSLRPTNAMHQLGVTSRVPLFNLTHLLDGLAQHGLLWVAGIPHPACLPGVLRAASHLASPVGFALKPLAADPDSLKEANPAALFHAAVQAAEGIQQPVPFCLHAEAPAVDGLDGMAFDAVRSFVGTCVQVGYTSFGVDLRACDEERAVEVARGLLGPVMELELGVSLRLAARGENLSSWADSLDKQIRHLLRAGMTPRLFVIDGPAELGEGAWGLAADLQAGLPPGCGLAWPSLRSMDRAGTRGLCDSPLAALMAEDRLERRFPDAQSLADPARLEALSYLEAMDLLEDLGGKQALGRWIQQVGQI